MIILKLLVSEASTFENNNTQVNQDTDLTSSKILSIERYLSKIASQFSMD